jgi:hypothetical protein
MVAKDLPGGSAHVGRMVVTRTSRKAINSSQIESITRRYGRHVHDKRVINVHMTSYCNCVCTSASVSHCFCSLLGRGGGGVLQRKQHSDQITSEEIQTKNWASEQKLLRNSWKSGKNSI